METKFNDTISASRVNTNQVLKFNLPSIDINKHICQFQNTTINKNRYYQNTKNKIITQQKITKEGIQFNQKFIKNNIKIDSICFKISNQGTDRSLKQKYRLIKPNQQNTNDSTVKNQNQLSIFNLKNQFTSDLKEMNQSNTDSSVTTEYQLSVNDQFRQKSVRFCQKLIQPRINPKKTVQSSNIRSSSILKKKSAQSITNQRLCQIKSLSKTSRPRQLQQTQIVHQNKQIKIKYQNLLKKYNQNNKNYKSLRLNYRKIQKYKDQLFPSIIQSIFSNSIHCRNKRPQKIQWRRIPEIFGGNFVTVRNQGKASIRITKGIMAESYFVMALTSISHNLMLLHKIFQIRQANLFGIYLIYIYMDNQWKYIIVDDQIPVVYDQLTKKYKPLFINVQANQTNNNTIQIWPLLLQKAFASYYLKYQALKYGNQINFLQQLTGTPMKILIMENCQNKSKDIFEIQNILRQSKGIILGQKIDQNIPQLYCMMPDLNSFTKESQNFCIYMSYQKQMKPFRQKTSNFLNSLTNIYIYQLAKPQFLTTSFICPQNNRKSQENSNFKSLKRLSIQTTIKLKHKQTLLRSFKINEHSKCVINIRQKDEKFYFHSKVEYKYIWVRAILLLKQPTQDYRWIGGLYSCNKSNSLFLVLQPGEYFLLLMPQWLQWHRYDILVNILCSHPLTIQKSFLNKDQKMLQKGCADLAQRFGCIRQINKFICSYNYVNKQIGLIIENIHNEREKGIVTIVRSINGLKSNNQLVPLNQQFYQCQIFEQKLNNTGLKIRKTIQVDILSQSSYTVVIKTLGGIDREFFQSFDFGCQKRPIDFDR